MSHTSQQPRRALCILAVLAMLAVATGIRAADLAGDWSFTLSAAEGEHSFEVTLAVEGAQVTGTTGDETLSGTFKDGSLHLSGDHYIGEAGYAAPLELTGTLDGDKITGEATWDVYEASLDGRRVTKK